MENGVRPTQWRTTERNSDISSSADQWMFSINLIVDGFLVVVLIIKEYSSVQPANWSLLVGVSIVKWWLWIRRHLKIRPLTQQLNKKTVECIESYFIEATLTKNSQQKFATLPWLVTAWNQGVISSWQFKFLGNFPQPEKLLMVLFIRFHAIRHCNVRSVNVKLQIEIHFQLIAPKFLNQRYDNSTVIAIIRIREG